MDSGKDMALVNIACQRIVQLQAKMQKYSYPVIASNNFIKSVVHHVHLTFIVDILPNENIDVAFYGFFFLTLSITDILKL